MAKQLKSRVECFIGTGNRGNARNLRDLARKIPKFAQNPQFSYL